MPWRPVGQATRTDLASARVAIHHAAQLAAAGAATLLPPAPEQKVVIECSGVRLEGVLLMDTPHHQQRMLPSGLGGGRAVTSA